MRNFVFKSILLLFGLIIGILLAECILRLDPSCSIEAMAKIHPNNSGRNWESCRFSNTLGYELDPRSESGINSFGMMDKEYPLVKPKDTFRILLLGDSITQDSGWSRGIEEELNKRGKYEVLNAAVMGWGLFQYHSYVRHKSGRLNPDLLLLGLCLNDAGSADFVQLMTKDPASENTMLYTIKGDNLAEGSAISLKINKFLFERSYIYRFIFKNYLYGKYLRDARKKLKYSEDSAAVKLSEMRDIFAGKVLVVVFPYLKPLNEYDLGEIQEYNQTTAALKEAHIDYIDLTAQFNKYGKGITKYRRSKDDKVHYNEEGNRLIADIVGKWLKVRLGNKWDNSLSEGKSRVQ